MLRIQNYERLENYERSEKNSLRYITGEEVDTELEHKEST